MALYVCACACVQGAVFGEQQRDWVAACYACGPVVHFVRIFLVHSVPVSPAFIVRTPCLRSFTLFPPVVVHRALSVSGNPNVTGSIPSAIGSLTTLTYAMRCE